MMKESGAYQYGNRCLRSMTSLWDMREQAECVLYSSGDELIKNYETDNIDIAFIDIVCGERKGFDIANELAEKGANVGVVYITGYDYLVYEAFESGPLGFVVK